MIETGSGSPASLGSRVREAVSDALAYWEPRRIVYNVALAVEFLGYFLADWPHSQTVVSFDGLLLVFILAVLANICYCAAYLADVFVQVSGFQEPWRRWRWVLFVVGLAVAVIVTRWFVFGFLAR